MACVPSHIIAQGKEFIEKLSAASYKREQTQVQIEVLLTEAYEVGRQKEREACAQLVERMAAEAPEGEEFCAYSEDVVIAAAIRNRKELD